MQRPQSYMPSLHSLNTSSSGTAIITHCCILAFRNKKVLALLGVPVTAPPTNQHRNNPSGSRPAAIPHADHRQRLRNCHPEVWLKTPRIASDGQLRSMAPLHSHSQTFFPELLVETFGYSAKSLRFGLSLHCDTDRGSIEDLPLSCMNRTTDYDGQVEYNKKKN